MLLRRVAVAFFYIVLWALLGLWLLYAAWKGQRLEASIRLDVRADDAAYEMKGADL